MMSSFFFFCCIYELGCIERNLNPTFIILIPKKEGFDDLKDFCLISLVKFIQALSESFGKQIEQSGEENGVEIPTCFC